MSNTKDKLSLIKLFTFTKQSLITATLILIFSIVERLANIGIDTEDNIKIFSVWCALLIFLYVIYVIIVLCSYHIFPKNKLKDDKIGVLFFIDTCDNKEDYKAIKEKLVDEFRKLSENNPYSDKKLSPIILSMKNVEVLKDKIYDRKEEEKLLKKTNCIFGVFFKAINEGRESLNYELNINAAITHPSMNTLTRKIFANNFSLILREVGVNKLNKNNELKDLNLIASKLYYICQLIYGVANSYTGYHKGALKLFKKMLNVTKNLKTQFYVNLTKILRVEICDCATQLASQEFSNFVNYKTYDLSLVHELLQLVKNENRYLKNDYNFLNYYLGMSIYYLLSRKQTSLAKNALVTLDKHFGNIPPNGRSWKFSEAFLFACDAKVEDYIDIEKKYQLVKYNTYEPYKIFNFINTYYNIIDSSTNIKLAMFWLVYYRNELYHYQLDPEFYKDLINDLENLTLTELSLRIKKIVTEEYGMAI